MSENKNIPTLKSVNIRSKDMKRKLIMSSGHVELLQAFLRKTIGNEVVVINTNIGTEIYYASCQDYSNFIKDSILLYTIKNIDPQKLQFKHTENPNSVENNFRTALLTFAQYPQLFLAYTKKFVFLRNNDRSSKIVMPALNNFFRKSLKFLVETKQIPVKSRILHNYEKVIGITHNNEIWGKLLSEILSREHIN